MSSFLHSLVKYKCKFVYPYNKVYFVVVVYAIILLCYGNWGGRRLILKDLRTHESTVNKTNIEGHFYIDIVKLML